MSEWMVAMFGEFGEAANIVKKLNRERDGFASFNKGATKDDLLYQLRDEIGDGFSYLILFCQAVGIDLLEAAEQKFDKVSKEKGYIEPFRPIGRNETETSEDTHSG
jgi:NTP pyrophosphatase (non-canonical NTP hydrolase)